MIEFESSSLKTSNEHVDVVQAVSLKLDAKKIGILLKSRKRPVANLALGGKTRWAAACCRAVPAWYRAAGSPSVAHELEPAPALAWPVDARNRDAEGGSLRGPNRPVLAARALPTPEGWPAASRQRSSVFFSSWPRRFRFSRS